MAKPSVTIGIAAFNESEVISKTLTALISQSKNIFVLDDILVYSDGSTDNTASIIKNDFQQVNLSEFSENKGKHARINQMLSNINSDIFILVDADMEFKSKDVLEHMVKLFDNENVGIVCAYHRVNKPRSLFGKIAYFGFKVWDSARESLRDAGIRYYCEGGAVAFSKAFVEKFRLPESGFIGDDTYCFYYAVQNYFEVKVAKDAKVYFDIAENVSDYTRQMKRFLADHGAVSNSFDEELVSKYETLTFKVAFKSLIKEGFKSPLIALLYVFLQASTKLQMPFYKTKAGWVHIRRTE